MFKLKFSVICLLVALHSINLNPADALVEDVIDVLHLAREVVKTIGGTWELVDQTGLGNQIDLPFLKRKEQKIILRMAELSGDIRSTEKLVRISIELHCQVTINNLCFCFRSKKLLW